MDHLAPKLYALFAASDKSSIPGESNGLAIFCLFYIPDVLCVVSPGDRAFLAWWGVSWRSGSAVEDIISDLVQWTRVRLGPFTSRVGAQTRLIYFQKCVVGCVVAETWTMET
jgi:hypothetical protein